MKQLILLSLLLPALAKAQTIAQKADELLTAYTNQNKFSGNVLIAKGDSILFKKAYGYADREAKKANTPETEFRIGSLTKMFTSTTILQLVNAGKLSLTDPVSKYVPGFPQGDKIQIRHLLSHTSGIKGTTTSPDPTTLVQSVAQFKSEPLAFTPGERFEYNNFNFILLSYIAQKITGIDYPELVQKNVLAKAGMQHSGLDYKDRQSANKAQGYITNPETAAWVRVDNKNVALASGAGAMYATVNDLLQWSKAIKKNVVLSAATLTQAWTPVQGTYGLGWIVGQHNGKKELGHTGSIEGFIANFLYYPEQDITIILLSNYGDVDGRQLSEDVKAVVFNEPYSLPRQRKAITLPAETLQQYAGVYQLNEHFTITVSVENGKLYALAQGDQDKVEFTPESETKFFLKGPETAVEFIKENGKVKYLFIDMQGGQKLTRMD